MFGIRETKLLWLKRFGLVLLGPLLFFVSLETVLRVAGYGGPSTFFQNVEIKGKNFAVENLQFGRRFFRKHVPRAPGWNLIPPPRDRVPRIAVIGESAAQGYPLQKIGLANTLQALLEIEYPGRSFDFINATMTSVNSHVLEQIVPEVVAQKPDVAVVYMGNNEVVGPYGPGTPFTRWMSSPLVVAVDKRISSTRVYDLVQSFLSPVTQQVRTWGGFQMFSDLRVPADSGELAIVYSAFERNLESIVSQLLSAGSRVVLCTVAVNLASWGPSGMTELPAGSRAAELLKSARRSIEREQFSDALLALEEAAELAPKNAEIPFLKGEALLGSNRPREARAFFEKARDLDEHRFRADSRINGIIRQVAAKYAPRGVVLVDADVNLAEDGLPGRRYFTEHVHLTFDGMTQLALLLSRVVGPLLPGGLGDRQEFTDANIPELKGRLFYTPFDEIVLNTMAREVGDLDIFRDRPGSDRSHRLLAEEESSLRSSFPLDAEQLRREYGLSKSLRPADSRVDESFAEYLWRLGQAAEASRAGKRALSRKPNFFLGLLMLANVAQQTGNLDAAENFYWKALELTPLLPQAWTGLGDVARQRGDKARAAECYEKALSLDASWITAAIALAEIQMENDDALHANQTLESLARNNPGSSDAVFAQARFYEARGDIDAAVSSYQRALELDQDLSPGHYLVFASRHFTPREMRAAFEKYGDRLGDSPVLWGNYAWLLATSHDPVTRDPAKALALAERAFELASPKNAHVYRVLAAAYAANGDFDRASDAIERASAFVSRSDALHSVLSKMAESFSMRLPYLEAAKKKDATD